MTMHATRYAYGTAARYRSPVGVVYLLHFARSEDGLSFPYWHARHYTGWTEDLFDRLEDHAAGYGANLTSVITRAGIGFVLARTCEGTRRTERAIKNAGGMVRYCPLCTAKPRNGQWGPLSVDLTPRYYSPRPEHGPCFVTLPALRYPAPAPAHAEALALAS
jgi:hypothetical protein